MKYLFFVFILILTISCSPKQGNKNESTKEPVTILRNKQDTSKLEYPIIAPIEKGAKVIFIEFDYHSYLNYDSIKVYKECNKESEYFFITKKQLEFRKIQGIKDWLYLSADNIEDNDFGFIYLYDISEKSF